MEGTALPSAKSSSTSGGSVPPKTPSRPCWQMEVWLPGVKRKMVETPVKCKISYTRSKSFVAPGAPLPPCLRKDLW
ncbi:unnamed protein product [Durusdinium trenchii]|uniref:Uncharacterized protein n=1 Tax=Durusdinium trenchii TaxID=1381693 RepID=A0ABP0MSR1_9DINO